MFFFGLPGMVGEFYFPNSDSIPSRSVDMMDKRWGFRGPSTYSRHELTSDRVVVGGGFFLGGRIKSWKRWPKFLKLVNLGFVAVNMLVNQAPPTPARKIVSRIYRGPKSWKLLIFFTKIGLLFCPMNHGSVKNGSISNGFVPFQSIRPIFPLLPWYSSLHLFGSLTKGNPPSVTRPRQIRP